MAAVVRLDPRPAIAALAYAQHLGHREGSRALRGERGERPHRRGGSGEHEIGRRQPLVDETRYGHRRGAGERGRDGPSPDWRAAAGEAPGGGDPREKPEREPDEIERGRRDRGNRGEERALSGNRPQALADIEGDGVEPQRALPADRRAGRIARRPGRGAVVR